MPERNTPDAFRSLLSLAEQAEPELAGPQQVEWLARLDKEYDSMPSALAWSISEGADLEMGFRLATALEPFWERRDLLAEGSGWLKALLEKAGQTGEQAAGSSSDLPAVPAEVLAKAVNASARLAYKQGALTEARLLYEDGLARYTDLQDPRGMASALVGLGHIARISNELSAAATDYRRALSLQRELGNKRGIASALWSLGQVAVQLGELMEASGLYDEAISFDRELGDREGEAYDLESAGHVAFLEGRYEDALACAEAAYALYRELGETANVAEVLDTLGVLAMLRGDSARATSLLEEAVSLARELEDAGPALAWPLCRLGILAADRGEYTNVAGLLRESLALFQGEEDPVLEGIGMCLLGYAALAEGRGELERSARLAATADALYESCDFVSRGYARAELTRRQEAARSVLSGDRFAAAWAAGRKLSLDEAILYAQEEG